MINHKIIAGWTALVFVLGLSLEAAIARWYPLRYVKYPRYRCDKRKKTLPPK